MREQGDFSDYLGNRGLARFLGVSSATVTRWVQKGGISPTLRTPRRYLWSPDEATRVKADWDAFCVLFRRFYGPESTP